MLGSVAFKMKGGSGRSCMGYRVVGEEVGRAHPGEFRGEWEAHWDADISEVIDRYAVGGKVEA